MKAVNAYVIQEYNSGRFFEKMNIKKENAHNNSCADISRKGDFLYEL